MPIHLRESFDLPVGTSGDRRDNPGELKPPELAALKLLLDLRLEILQFDLHAIIDVSVIHVFFSEETGFPSAFLRFILDLPPAKVLVLHCPLVGRGTDIS